MKFCAILAFLMIIEVFNAASADEIDKISPRKYSWCIDSNIIDEVKMLDIYRKSEEIINKNPNFFLNGNNTYYKVKQNDKEKLLLILSDHSWKRGVFDVESRIKSIIDSANSLTVEDDGLSPNSFNKMNWDISGNPAGREMMSDIINKFPTSQLNILTKIMNDDFNIDKNKLKSMPSSVISAILSKSIRPNCDNRLANTMIAIYSGNDMKLNIQFLSDGRKVYAARSFLDEAKKSNNREQKLAYFEPISEFINVYFHSKENLALELIANYDKRPDILTLVTIGGWYSQKTFDVLSSHMMNIITDKEREDGLYAATRARLSDPGLHVIAYGALHFIGRNGIIERLRASGLVVEPIQ